MVTYYNSRNPISIYDLFLRVVEYNTGFRTVMKE